MKRIVSNCLFSLVFSLAITVDAIAQELTSQITPVVTRYNSITSDNIARDQRLYVSLPTALTAQLHSDQNHTLLMTLERLLDDNYFDG
ncbi:MAG: hypothetical protein F6K11_27375 [Leptolyngbya sp. SIO3F4]|nr:hypothetical protein [Leptolyngbya sp. SIO3F4]